MRQAAELGLRRAGDHQRVHAGGLGGHHVHHHAGRVDRVAARHVEADPLDRHPAFGDRRAGRQRRRGVGAPLVGVHGAGPLDGDLQRRADVGVELGQGAVQLSAAAPGPSRAERRRTIRRTPARPSRPARRPRRRSGAPWAPPRPRRRRRAAARPAAAPRTASCRAGRCGTSSEPHCRRHQKAAAIHSRDYSPRAGTNRYWRRRDGQGSPQQRAGRADGVPAAVENFQIKYINPMIKPSRAFMPGLATIKHRGRKSGKPYETDRHRLPQRQCAGDRAGTREDRLGEERAGRGRGRRALHSARPCTSSTRGSCPPAAAPSGCRGWPGCRRGKMAIFVADIA